MKPQRISVKLRVRDASGSIDLQPLIGIFHRFIQRGSVEGVLIDVADYAHVPNGPGVMLIGHEVDYALDQTGGETGLLAVRKRPNDESLADMARDALRKALIAVRAIEADPATDLRFSTDTIELRVLDRRVAQNSAEDTDAIRKEVAPVFAELFGDTKHEISRIGERDPRSPAALRVVAQGAESAEALLEQLGGAPALALASDWEIEPEQLRQLREGGSDHVLLDVREPHEYEASNLGGVLIPLGELEGRLGELDSTAHIVVHCKTGARGTRATLLLRQAGFANAWNLSGGLQAWIDQIDPSLPKP